MTCIQLMLNKCLLIKIGAQKWWHTEHLKEIIKVINSDDHLIKSGKYEGYKILKGYKNY